MMIPTQLLMIPTYIMFTKIGIVNTLPSIIVPWLTSAFGVFLMRQFFLSLPVELEEAARLDGCSQFGVFWRIVLPLAKPALATLAIFTLLGSWNDLIWPLISISDDRWYTLQLGLANFQGTRRTQWQLLMDGRQCRRDGATRCLLPHRPEALHRNDDLQRAQGLIGRAEAGRRLPRCLVAARRTKAARSALCWSRDGSWTYIMCPAS